MVPHNRNTAATLAHLHNARGIILAACDALLSPHLPAGLRDLAASATAPLTIIADGLRQEIEAHGGPDLYDPDDSEGGAL